jgi:hypothetical protein
MHSVLRWAVAHLNYMVAVAFVSSVLSVVFSIVQVHKKTKEAHQRLKEQEAKLSQELNLALLTYDTGQVRGGLHEKMSDGPAKHGALFAPSGQEGVRTAPSPRKSALGSAA